MEKPPPPHTSPKGMWMTKLTLRIIQFALSVAVIGCVAALIPTGIYEIAVLIIITPQARTPPTYSSKSLPRPSITNPVPFLGRPLRNLVRQRSHLPPRARRPPRYPYVLHSQRAHLLIHPVPNHLETPLTSQPHSSSHPSPCPQTSAQTAQANKHPTDTSTHLPDPGANVALDLLLWLGFVGGTVTLWLVGIASALVSSSYYGGYSSYGSYYSNYNSYVNTSSASAATLQTATGKGKALVGLGATLTYVLSRFCFVLFGVLVD